MEQHQVPGALTELRKSLEGTVSDWVIEELDGCIAALIGDPPDKRMMGAGDKSDSSHQEAIHIKRLAHWLKHYDSSVIETAEKLLQKEREYRELIDKELSDVVTIAAVHGWKSDDYERGVQLRKELAELQKAWDAIKV